MYCCVGFEVFKIFKQICLVDMGQEGQVWLGLCMDIYVDYEVIDLDREMQKDSIKSEICEKFLKKLVFNNKIIVERRVEVQEVQ